VIGHASLVVSQQALEVLAAQATDVNRGGAEAGDKSGTDSDSSNESERSEDSEE
jgi:hypothetical protein